MLKKNIYKSAIIGLLEELVSVISGLILPRMILTYFGSSSNGIVSAVTQFIGCISILKAGIGMATRAALYKPLYEHDQKKIDGIMSATTSFVRKVAMIFVVGIIIFSCVYPLLVKNEFSWSFSASLVIIISLGTFFQYYFGLANQLFLQADQKYYVVSIVNIVNTVLNTIVSVICIQAGMGLRGVKFFSALVFSTTPIILNWYVSKKYHLNRKEKPDNNSIAKRWDAFGIQVANFINNNTDIIVASLFLNLKEVSVYTVYYLAINGIKKIINRVTASVEAAFGSIYAQSDSNKIRKAFTMFEYILNFGSAFAFSCLLILILPFVTVYTKGVTDVNYSRPLFAVIACMAEMFFCIRLVYTFVVQSTGFFAETKKYSYIESALNIISSVILVNVIGLNGVVVGTLLAMIYRTVVFAKYSYKNIIELNFWLFIKRMAVTLGIVAADYFVGNMLVSLFPVNDYIQWCAVAIVVSTVVIAITLIAHIVIYPSLSKDVFTSIISKLGKTRKKQTK